MATIANPVVPGSQTPAPRNYFQRFAWVVLAWNMVVVLWGAYVRASGSGAGCGNTWPFCNGEMIPSQWATILAFTHKAIEFTHRLSSGLALALVVALYVWAVRRFPEGHRARRYAYLSIMFILMEAALGAGLVLFNYVGKNESAGRAIYLAAHLTNTQILLAVLTMTAYFSRLPSPEVNRPAPRALQAALLIALVVSVTGAIAALSDTLYPASSFASGLAQELSATATLTLRLRLLHPVLAILGGLYIIAVAFVWQQRLPTHLATMTALAAIAQLSAGAINVALLTPSWMQILHLLLGAVLWILLVMLTLRAREARA